MIRNPSDGTTYDPPKPEKGIPVSGITGLPELEMGNPKSKDEIRRLEESREWLKQRKISTYLREG
jgi:hypothetical protein